MVTLLTIVFFLICILIVIAVLIQPHEEEGMGGIFGSSGPESFFGGKGNITMIKITAVLGILYFIIAIGIHKLNATRHITSTNKKGVTSQTNNSASNRAAIPVTTVTTVKK